MAQEAYEIDPKIPLQCPIATRDGTLSKDSLMRNCYSEVCEGGKVTRKRPGLSLGRQLTPGVGQGLFINNNVPYAIQNDTIVNLDTGVGTAIPAVTVAGQQYQSLSDVPFGTSLLKSGDGLWVFTGGVCTKVVDPNYPALTVFGIAYLDGTYYVMDGFGKVFGSALEDATTWPALNFIGADATLGLGAAITRHLNYIVAFYEHGTQFFYDAANPTGSPLSPVGNASWTTGAAVGSSVVEISDQTFWIGQTRQRGRTIETFNGLAKSIVSTPFIEKILNRSQFTDVGGLVFSFGLKTDGHTFFVLTITDVGCTLVYDAIMNEWHAWTSVTAGVESEFRYINYLAAHTVDLLQERSSGAIVQVLPTVFQDTGNPIRCFIRTKPYDFGTLRQKRYPSLSLIADTVQSTIAVSHSDDDYTTFSVPRDVNLASVRKMLLRNGQARRRSWDLLHVANTPLGLYEVEFNDMSISST